MEGWYLGDYNPAWKDGIREIIIQYGRMDIWEIIIHYGRMELGRL